MLGLSSVPYSVMFAIKGTLHLLKTVFFSHTVLTEMIFSISINMYKEPEVKSKIRS